MEIRKIAKEELPEAVSVLNRSFRTVADRFGMTAENAPTNPAFLKREDLEEWLKKEVFFFGLFEINTLYGCIATERSSKDHHVFYVERLCVLPEMRHCGFGRELLDFASAFILSKGGTRIEIGIIDENTILKNWYSSYGFAEISRKNFPHLPFTVCFMGKDI